jgi:predicted glycogen debranching enzyme
MNLTTNIQVDKTKLQNLEYSLFREILRTNRAGGYSSSSIIGCNTRKYHGLLVCPIADDSDDLYVMLSSLQCSVIQRDKIFNLGIQQYQNNNFEPKGHKYVWDFETSPIPTLTYRVGGVVLQQEMLLSANEHQVMIRYTLIEAHSPTRLRLKPFLAFRNIHELTHQNMNANTHYSEVKNGIGVQLYHNLPPLFMQTNKKSEFIPVPDWYRNIEYIKEQIRGYEYREDLYVPGYFETDIEKGESIVFAAGLNEAQTTSLKAKFTREVNTRTPRLTMVNNLINAAQQFIVNKKNHSTLIAGYHWYKDRLRDTLIALPGLSLYQENKKPFLDILESATQKIKNEYLDKAPDTIQLTDAGVPLWFFVTLHKSPHLFGNGGYMKKYRTILREILDFYSKGIPGQLRMLDNGLIYAKRDNVPLTWMNAMTNNQPATPRYGSPVEINALWYNAVATMVNDAKEIKDTAFINRYEPLLRKLDDSFPQTYWNSDKGYLYDCDDMGVKDKSLRPNQIFAVALPYSPLLKEQKKSILDTVMKELMTSKGVRSLSPQDSKYKGVVEGNQEERGAALHQGAVYPWLTAFVADAQVSINNKSSISVLRKIVEEFESEMTEHCLGTISECYNGNPPHQAKGAVSMAWNVAALLQIIKIIEINA